MVSKSGSDQTEDLAEGSDSSPRARVFVALKIEPGIADELARMALDLERFPVRLIAPADIHLTLVPPWNEVSIPGAVGKLRGVAGRFGKFVLEFRHVGYGPDPRRPRFLWVECAGGPDLAQLRASLLVAFEQTDERPFRPHVTLARLRANGRTIARICPIDRELALTQRIGSIELLQSPAPGETGYKPLASLPFGTAPELPRGPNGV